MRSGRLAASRSSCAAAQRLRGLLQHAAGRRRGPGGCRLLSPGVRRGAGRRDRTRPWSNLTSPGHRAARPRAHHPRDRRGRPGRPGRARARVPAGRRRRGRPERHRRGGRRRARFSSWAGRPALLARPAADGRPGRRGGRAAGRERPAATPRTTRPAPTSSARTSRLSTRRTPPVWPTARSAPSWSSHDAFGYLGRYGLEFEPIAGLSPGAEPTPADLGPAPAARPGRGHHDGLHRAAGRRGAGRVARRRPRRHDRRARPDRGADRRDRGRGLPLADGAEPRRPPGGERMPMTHRVRQSG